MSICARLTAADAPDLDPAYYHDGELFGSLRSAGPLPLYDADPQHLWNRLHAAISIRESDLPSKRGGTPVKRIEGGDRIEFLGWPGTTYWDEPATVDRIEALLAEFKTQHGEQLIDDPLKKVILQRDLWTVFDYSMSRNIERRGDLETRKRRQELCRQLAEAIRTLALPADQLANLPDNYAIAVESEHFDATHDFDPARNYLPPHLLTDRQEWPELDFHQPQRHEDIERRFVFLHMRAFRGRSYFRVFYRFPEGRGQLEQYLKDLDENWVDWRFASLNGHIRLKPETPQIPAGTEVALVQFLIALDPQLNLVPTKIVETVRVAVYKSVNGENDPTTNTNYGVNVEKFTLKRRLAFDGLKYGGLEREPDHLPVYRILFESESAVDWGPRGRFFELANDCRLCHAGSGLTGVHTIPSLVNSGSSDSAAQPGIVHTIPADAPSPHPARTIKWKSADETYRRLVEFFE
jgi:hypothetical protein